MDRALIVDAGVTGLTCAVALARLYYMNVTVLERSARISDKGNGIQIPCNATRVLQQLGVLEHVLEHAGGPATATISLDYRNGNTLLSRDVTACAEIYKTPWILIHRGAYIGVLYQKALKLGVKFRFDCSVSHVHTQDRPKVQLGNEEGYIPRYGAPCFLWLHRHLQALRRIEPPTTQKIVLDMRGQKPALESTKPRLDLSGIVPALCQQILYG